jgi:hypothetical protein
MQHLVAIVTFGITALPLPVLIVVLITVPLLSVTKEKRAPTTMKKNRRAMSCIPLPNGEKDKMRRDSAHLL